MSISTILTIGMPVYNRELFVEDAIKSILNQQYKDFILLISDNCSTDGTRYICQKYVALDSRVKYFRHSENLGMVENFQFLLDNCETDYFMWAASDDLWTENWISELLPLAKIEGVIPVGSVDYIDAENKPKKGLRRSMDFSSKYRLFRRLKFLWNLNPLPLFGIFKTDLIRRNWRNIFGININGKLHYRSGGDFYLCYEILKNQRFVHNNNCIRFGRIHKGNSIDFNDYKKKLSFLEILSSIFTQINPILIIKNSNIFEIVFIIPIYIFIMFRECFMHFLLFSKKMSKFNIIKIIVCI